ISTRVRPRQAKGGGSVDDRRTSRKNVRAPVDKRQRRERRIVGGILFQPNIQCLSAGHSGSMHPAAGDELSRDKRLRLAARVARSASARRSRIRGRTSKRERPLPRLRQQSGKRRRNLARAPDSPRAIGSTRLLGVRSREAGRARRYLPQKGARVVCADKRSTTKTEPRLRLADIPPVRCAGGRPAPGV